MSWPDANFSRRVPFVIDGSATAAGTIDATLVLSRDDALFWATIQADGDDVRVYAADGLTGIGYDLDGFNYTTKTVTIEMDDLSHHVTNTMTVGWLLFGDADAANDEDGFVPSSPLNAYTLNIGPAPGERIYALGSPVGDTVPSQQAQKRSTETAYLWFFVGPLGMREEPYEGRPDGEEPQSLSVTVVTPGTFTANTSAIRLTFGPNRSLVARVTVSGGTDGATSNIVLSVVTTSGRTIQGTVLMTCEDL